MSAVTVFYKGTGGFTPPGSYWQIASGVLGPNGQVLPQPNNTPYFDGIPQPYLPGACSVMVSRNAPNNPPPACTQALSHFHSFLTYQPLLDVPRHRDRHLPGPGCRFLSRGMLIRAALPVLAATLVLAGRDG